MTDLQRRLPGVRVETPTPAPREALPRMDIALFVGFAAAGPIDLPVAVESLGEFEAVFGTEVVLARAEARGQVLGGLLHPCIRGFFSSGGRRCWIVRVAGDAAHTARFPLADLLIARRADAAARWRVEPALVAARSPGSWADGLTVASRLSAQPVQIRPVSDVVEPAPSVDILDAPALSLAVGEMLRAAIDKDYWLHARIAALAPPESEPGGRLRRRARLDGLCALSAQTSASPSAAISHVSYFEPTGRGAEQNEQLVAAQGRWLEGRLILRFSVPAGRVPHAGAILGVHFTDATSGWFQVAESVPTQIGGADGSIGLDVRGQLWKDDGDGWVRRVHAWLGDPDDRGNYRERQMHWLRLDLRTRDGRSPDFVLEGLSMATPEGDARSARLGIATLPDDQRFFGPDGASAAADLLSHSFELTRRDNLGRLARRFPLASLPVEGELMLIPLGSGTEFGPGLGAVGIDAPRLERDGLADFSWRLFAEPLLADSGSEALADQAEALRFISSDRRVLRGMHAAFGSGNVGVVDEPTLLAIPDAVHPGWDESSPQPAWTELPPAPPAPAPPCDDGFSDCAMTPLPAPRFVRGRDPDADGSFLLQWTQPEPGVTYEVEVASDASFAAAAPAYSGVVPRFPIVGQRTGSQCFRVRCRIGQRLSAWSSGVEVRVGAGGYEARAWRPDDLLAIHRLMLRTAAGRGDMLAVLGLPSHYRFADAVTHASALREPPRGLDAATPRAIGADEQRALSHGALYHPWLLTRRVDTVVASPPDGAVCGQLAAGALERGAWVAVANQPLRDVVALSAAAARDELQALLDVQVNVVRSTPHGFVLSTADTLTPEADWRPINVRRLMTLLRRLALRRGATYVFEPNGATLRRTVERSFEAVMDELFRRGAFAGATARTAYRVDVGDDLNTPYRSDRGEFRVDLKVAPSLPLTFLTVRLARSGERLVARETR